MNTTDRIETILRDINIDMLEKTILKLQLEALVLQAQIEQLQKH